MNKRFYFRFFFILTALFLFIASFFSLPYYVSKPGMAKELRPIIEVKNGYDEEGTFMLTTIRMGKANIYSYVMASLSDYQEIYPLDAVRGEEETEEEYNVRQLHLMASSKQSAIEVAYKKAEIPIEYEYKGVYVLNVIDNMPAAGKLEPGDRIFKVNGDEFTSSEEFIEFVSNQDAGTEIALTFLRRGEEMETVIEVQPFPDDKTKVGVGIGLVDDKELHVNPNVDIKTDDIGGPSAGFMFSLEIYNQLIEEDLTKGYEIAGTGTISPDGKIGRIGGIEQKIVAADKAGAEIFFAPNEEGATDSNYNAAVKTAEDIKTDMKIIPVDTFDEAIDYLMKLEEKK
ncbi:SepM family pheromone-processing serine protease [Robertmurraya massiliosenegalensis]|uniref:SepM family pheromone-processing serine protease n=1 Tax=Robertmurraya massiliosenegalensis TaxID=1287657 RepID=UPI00031AB851|nr:SepM family pheromone-processing serine protease [Robertmurraya massiliosenegalensis]